MLLPLAHGAAGLGHKNGVKPPEYATFPTETWIAAANMVKSGSASCAGCVSGIKDRLDRGEVARADDRASERPGRAATDVREERANTCAAPVAAVKKKFYTGLAISAMKCRGLHSLVVVALPPSLNLRMVHAPVQRRSGPRLVFIDDAATTSRSLETPAPPPRGGAIAS